MALWKRYCCGLAQFWRPAHAHKKPILKDWLHWQRGIFCVGVSIYLLFHLGCQDCFCGKWSRRVDGKTTNLGLFQQQEFTNSK